ncbi:MAG TPA: transglycosylase domain-containing protein [Thermoleophilaceae bacterium]|jgi:penicillin-binding protein 1A|nr:transglycosylase domain-containing protein [Thermoleophilaceae bacterium]
MNEPPTPTLLRTPAADGEAATNGGPPDLPKPKLKKLRLAFVLGGLGAIAFISTVFGMMMAVASDLPSLENKAEFRSAKNSELLAADGHTRIAKLTGNQNRILVGQADISPMIKNAVISIEDRRFYEHKGVDYKGIARAFEQDLLRRRAAQGASTITQQFVKNALAAQGNRSVFEKLREAALAYHMERRWTKQKILTQYLNSVYFGNGAYGVESAMRTYFGSSGGTPLGAVQCCAASNATPAQAALLAGMIASPSMFDPVQNPRHARLRRNEVLDRMLAQGMITHAEHESAVQEPVPNGNQVSPPKPDSSQPYFSTWLTQQLVDRYRPGTVFGGGLKIKTTLDPELQAAAENAISRRLSGIGPDSALVAIENKTGEVKAMVGGNDYAARPFNLATNGHRQPGSSFKPFTLITALEHGVGPDATFASKRKVFPVPGSKTEKFVANNYQNEYAGIASLRSATATSDNSVYAELGLRMGTKNIARTAHRLGVRTPISTNPAMTLGGLKEGVTPLEMAYAYSTIANRGERVTGTLAPDERGPVAIESVNGDGIDDKDKPRGKRVFSTQVGDTAQQLLAGVIQSGTGRAAQIGEFAAGKTGTTENYGDAWFVGFNKELTVAVWVGYANKLKPMETEFHGSEVAGGTFPAEIWHDFMTSWIGIRDRRDAASGKKHKDVPVPTTAVPSGPIPPAEQSAPAPDQQQTTAPAGGTTGGGTGNQTPKQPQAPQKPTPTPAPAPTPQPQGGGGGGTGGGAGAPPG